MKKYDEVQTIKKTLLVRNEYFFMKLHIFFLYTLT